MRYDRRLGRVLAWIAAIIAPMIPAAAVAGPPFVTDDPVPTDPHKWEIYNFATGAREFGVTSADMGVDLNYGPAKDVQLTTTLPMHVETGSPLGAGDVEMAVKYRFLHQHAGTASADVAFFPRVFLPTGRGSRRAQVLLPVWAQRDFGPWSLFGGGGYLINPGVGQRNTWQQGVVVTRQIRPGFQFGVEYYGHGRSSDDDRAVHGVNLATIIHISGPFSLLTSAGQGLNRKQTIFYTALKLDL